MKTIKDIMEIDDQSNSAVVTFSETYGLMCQNLYETVGIDNAREQMREQRGGMLGELEVMREWSIQFDEMNRDREWDGEFIDEVDSFFSEHIKEWFTKEDKIHLVVFKEHTLGYTLPGDRRTVHVLQSSMAKGAPFETHPESKHAQDPDKDIRLATEKDFEEFRVMVDGYKNDPEYLLGEEVSE